MGDGRGWRVKDESISALSMSRLSVRFITLRNASSTPEKFTLARARNRIRARAKARPNQSQFFLSGEMAMTFVIEKRPPKKQRHTNYQFKKCRALNSSLFSELFPCLIIDDNILTFAITHAKELCENNKKMFRLVFHSSSSST